MDAFYTFLADDGWAIASHIALSTLMALFPFLIVLTSLAGFFFGSKELADQAEAVAEPRRWYWLRLESIGYTLVAAFTSLAMAFLIVLGPLIIEAVRRYIPLIVENNEQVLKLSRYGITSTHLIAA